MAVEDPTTLHASPDGDSTQQQEYFVSLEQKLPPGQMVIPEVVVQEVEAELAK